MLVQRTGSDSALTKSRQVRLRRPMTAISWPIPGQRLTACVYLGTAPAILRPGAWSGGRNSALGYLEIVGTGAASPGAGAGAEGLIGFGLSYVSFRCICL